MWLVALLGCSGAGRVASTETCDPRALAPGEVRARQVPCSEELVAGGEGRVGDWLLENAVARFLVRGTYAALTYLEEPGGTLIDAAPPEGEDLLLELFVDADRSDIAAVNGDGEARLELPGVIYRLEADSDVLHIEGPDGAALTGTLQGLPEVERTSARLSDGARFFGIDAIADRGEGQAPFKELTRAALSPASLWPDGAWRSEPVDADGVLLMREGEPLYRAPVEEGLLEAWFPTGAEGIGERIGCAYEGLTPRGCGWLQLRVAEPDGTDIQALLIDPLGIATPVPRGGGLLPVGPEPGRFELWAGPSHAVAALSLPGGDASRTVTLAREMDAAGAVLAALAVEVAPDASTTVTPAQAVSELAGEGVGFVVLLADDEIPTVDADPHDPVLAVAGSRAENVVWSWPWTANSRRAAHGAVPWEGLSALDLLAVTEGGQSAARRTVVDVHWVERARLEADPLDWDPKPDALWLNGTSELPIFLALLDDWVDVAPVGPRTWVDVDGAENTVAVEAGLVAGRTSAGNGPRLILAADGRTDDGWRIRVRLEAPRWMHMQRVTLWTSAGASERAVTGAGTWKWTVPSGTTWVVAVAEGGRSRPGGLEPAWAITAPLWLRQP